MPDSLYHEQPRQQNKITKYESEQFMTSTNDMNRRDAITLMAGATTGLAFTCATTGLMFAGTATHAEEKRMPPAKFDYDVVIVGGGPSGLSAALVLGRSCRKVLLCDAGKPRNNTSPAVHGFFSRDGISPSELLKIGRDQLQPYAVERHDGRIDEVDKIEAGFSVRLGPDQSVTTRKLILATGITDKLPDIPGIQDWWGTGVLHCPFCHGWEVRNEPWAYVCPTEDAIERATLFLGWTKSLTFLTNGEGRLTPDQAKWLAEHGVAVREETITKLDGNDGKLTKVALDKSNPLNVKALFVHGEMVQRSDLPRRLGCKFVTEGKQAGLVETDPFGGTSVPGLYVVGDASVTGFMNVTGAVADGASVGAAVQGAMLKEDASYAMNG